MVIGLFIWALLKRWWALMGSAAFTLLGIWADLHGKSDTWLVKTSICAAVLSFLVASFLAWKEEHVLAALHEAPEVMLSFDTNVEPFDRKIQVHNTGKGTALNVGLRPIDKSYECYFEAVPYLEEGKIRDVPFWNAAGKDGWVAGLSGSFLRDLLTLRRIAGEAGYPFVFIPIVVSYANDQGTRFEREFNLQLDATSGRTRMLPEGRKRMVKNKFGGWFNESRG
jgi:hypothetical protein